MTSADSIENAPVRTSSSVPPTAWGRPAAMPAKMMSEIPLPIPRSVICSPSHIKNMVPVVSVTMAVRRNTRPGSITRPACDSMAIAIPMLWNVASATVP